MRKILSVFLTICILFCTSGCAEKKQYVYSGVGYIFSKYVYVFDKKITSNEGGNYKWIFNENWEKTEDFNAVSFDECLEYGTFEWQAADEILTLTPSDGTRATDYYIINDILVHTYDYDSAEEVKRVGDYIVGTVQNIANITVFNSDGSFIFYLEGNSENYRTGEYYIDGNLIYEKDSNDNEYNVGALLFDEKVVDLSLSAAYVLEK